MDTQVRYKKHFFLAVFLLKDRHVFFGRSHSLSCLEVFPVDENTFSEKQWWEEDWSKRLLVTCCNEGESSSFLSPSNHRMFSNRVWRHVFVMLDLLVKALAEGDGQHVLLNWQPKQHDLLWEKFLQATGSPVHLNDDLPYSLFFCWLIPSFLFYFVFFFISTTKCNHPWL